MREREPVLIGPGQQLLPVQHDQPRLEDRWLAVAEAA